MLIMTSRKMIYVHLHKCGGTSVERSLEKFCRWNDVLIGSSALGEHMQWQYHGRFGLHKHSTADEIRNVIGDAAWSGYYSWCTVRNPFGRIASLYGFARYLFARNAAKAGYPINASLEEQRQWVRSGQYPNTEPWNFAAVKALVNTRGEARPYSAFLRDPNLLNEVAFRPQWQSVQSGEGDKMAVSQIVKLEELAEQWPRICERFGLQGAQLVSANVTDQKFRIAAQDFFRAPEDMALVRNRFAVDFERFNYDANRVL